MTTNAESFEIDRATISLNSIESTLSHGGQVEGAPDGKAIILCEHIRMLFESIDFSLLPKRIANEFNGLINKLEKLSPYLGQGRPDVLNPLRGVLQELYALIKPYEPRAEEGTRPRVHIAIRDMLASVQQDMELISRRKDDALQSADGIRELRNGAMRSISDIHKIKDASKKLNEALESELSSGTKTLAKIKDVHTGADQLLESMRGKFENQLAEIQNSIAYLDQYFKKVFGDGKSNESDSLKRKLEEIIRKASDLANQLDGYLPGSTSKGISEAMEVARESAGKASRNYAWAFYATLAALACLSWFDNSWMYRVFDLPNMSSEPLVNFLIDVTIRLFQLSPIIWLALFFAQRRREQSRLMQEYLHKAAVAKSYVGYSAQVEALGLTTENLKEELLRVAIDALAINAAKTLDKQTKNDTPIEAALDLMGKAKNIVLPKS